MIFEHLRKIKIYFKQWNSYWQLNSSTQALAIDPGKVGRYPLDFKPRIIEGHYPHFDKNGVPMWPRPNGSDFFYHYTTMFSYALGQSDYFLLTGDKLHLDKVIAVADYIQKTGVSENNGISLKEVDDNNNHTGNVSAMTQGEAISVLCRAYQYSGNYEYLNTAEKLLSPFRRDIKDGGVLGFITSLGINWYEEYVNEPLNHVLNGMVYSIWGLKDLYAVTENKTASKLYIDGINFLKKALPSFDTGFWTYYWIPESGKNYVSSMMYHNLHICQLQALYQQTGEDIFKFYSDRFIKYASNPINRFRAAKAITLSKVLN
jgi:heparosan-N-sulfate-glucuronate 5-epimerase